MKEGAVHPTKTAPSCQVGQHKPEKEAKIEVEVAAKACVIVRLKLALSVVARLVVNYLRRKVRIDVL